ncbi:HAD-IIB family hydrolase [Hoeflea ulvae]|uniref:HAD-IIB family hydrolase n=1 Tax=Hoeflea ulvae TaxID=2983764 RepID=A0ABT3YLJ4_9HYPH|nr:HAD-IIB family hydrolase [Hoeflea ulvae]MCY0096723.1 HAD-IIB family hydrolase [Hoeflea ulvae]
MTGGTVTIPDISGLIIFTDLDGTLLDHQTYAYTEALPALARLRELQIPLVLASSKTAAEIIPLRRELGFAHCPAIVENGSGILEGDENATQSGDMYQSIRETLDALPPALRSQYQGFSDWSVEEVSRRTGLSLEQAALAKQRRFSEPGLWLGTDNSREEFVAMLTKKGLSVLQGGRFMTLSFGANKAQRMIEIARRHALETGHRAFTVALGDAGNDVAMIEQADLGVIIPNPGHAGIPRLAREDSGHIIRAAQPGPRGWNETIMSLVHTAAK